MARYRLKNDDGIYFKEYDPSKESITFTNKQSESKDYPNGEWWAQTELDFLKFHFEETNPELKSMVVAYC
jgi:hypothetical protein